MAPSIYEPLDVKEFEIRLLTILPGDLTSTIKCKLTIWSLRNPVSYAALSYCWGSPATKTKVIINGIETYVTVNLEEALKQLRKMGVSQVWADAICINQQNDKEKTFQVRMMKDIYQTAAITYAWLGRDGPDGAATAINCLRTLINDSLDDMAAYKRHSHGGQEPKYCPRCCPESTSRALSGLFSREYWKRRWIIQELVVSLGVELVCGNATITLDDFAHTVNVFASLRAESRDPDDRYYEAIIDFRSSYRRRVGFSLLQAIIATRRSLSQDPRDKVYALLGICTDGAAIIPTPSYQIPLVSLATRLTRSFVRLQGSLDIIIADLGREERSSKLPSWAPDWFQVETFSKAAEDFADQRSHLDFSFLPGAFAVDEAVLPVQGSVIGRVADVAHPVIDSPPLTSIEGNADFTRRVTTGTPFYNGAKRVREAILCCLLGRDQGHWNCYKTRIYGQPSTLSVVWNDLFWFRRRAGRFNGCLSGTRKGSSPYGGNITHPATREMFENWVKQNGNLVVNNKALIEWFTETRFFDSLAWSMVLAFSVPVLVCAPAIIASVYIDVKVIKSTPGRILVPLLGLFLGVLLFIYWLFLLRVYVLWKCNATHHFRNIAEDELPCILGGCYGYKLIIADKGFIGMASGGAQVGDYICSLVGCSRIVILRPTQRPLRAQAQPRSAGAGPHLTKQYKIVCTANLQTEFGRPGLIAPGSRGVTGNLDWSPNEDLQRFREQGTYVHLELI